MCLQLLKTVPARAWFASSALAAFALVIVGLQLQELYRLAPCPFCIFQRVLYLVIGGVAVFGWFWPRWTRLWSVLVVVLAVIGLGFAGYQSWLQAFPHLATECSYTDPGLVERFVDWLGMLNPSLFLATGFCASRDWLFLGLSMANWSLLVFGGYVVLGVSLFRRRQV